MIEIRGLAHFGIPVSDMAVSKSKPLYTDAFFEEDSQGGPVNGAR